MKSEKMIKKKSDAETTVCTLNENKSNIYFNGEDVLFGKTNIKIITKSLKKELIIIIIISFYLLLVELLGGCISRSLMIFTDINHLFSNLLGFIVTLISLSLNPAKFNGKKNDFKLSGIEILCSLYSILFVWFMNLFILYNAFRRFFRILDGEKIKVDFLIMLITSFLGFSINLIRIYFSQKIKKYNIKNFIENNFFYNNKKTIIENSEKKNKPKIQINFKEDNKEKDNKMLKNLNTKNNSESDNELEKDLKILINNLENPNIKKTLIKQEKKSEPKIEDILKIKPFKLLQELTNSFLVILFSSIIFINEDLIILDPILSIIFTIISLSFSVSSTLYLLRNFFYSISSGFNANKIRRELLNVRYVVEIRDLEIKKTFGESFLTVKIIYKVESQYILKKVFGIFKKFGIYHTRVEMEIFKNDLVINNFD